MIPMYYVYNNVKVEEEKNKGVSVLAPCSLVSRAYEFYENLNK